MESLIKIDNITKTLGKNQILKGLSLDIAKNERICIIGINGGGKTTLINHILGLYKPDTGTVSYPAHNNKISHFLKDTGIQFQDATLPQSYTINDIFNLIYGAIKKPKLKDFRDWVKNEREPKKNELLTFFNLEKRKNVKIKSLSGGQKQRLNILLSLINDPKVLILDELTTGLDIKAQRTLLRYINEYQKNNKITTIIISHILQEMQELADRIVLLEDGIIKEDNTVNVINKKYGNLEKYLDQVFIPNSNMEVHE